MHIPFWFMGGIRYRVRSRTRCCFFFMNLKVRFRLHTLLMQIILQCCQLRVLTRFHRYMGDTSNFMFTCRPDFLISTINFWWIQEMCFIKCQNYSFLHHRICFFLGIQFSQNFVETSYSFSTQLWWCTLCRSKKIFWKLLIHTMYSSQDISNIGNIYMIRSKFVIDMKKVMMFTVPIIPGNTLLNEVLKSWIWNISSFKWCHL